MKGKTFLFLMFLINRTLGSFQQILLNCFIEDSFSSVNVPYFKCNSIYTPQSAWSLCVLEGMSE